MQTKGFLKNSGELVFGQHNCTMYVSYVGNHRGTLCLK